MIIAKIQVMNKYQLNQRNFLEFTFHADPNSLDTVYINEINETCIKLASMGYKDSVDRILDLVQYNLSEDGGVKKLQIKSLNLFVNFLKRKYFTLEPLIYMSDNGMIIAEWHFIKNDKRDEVGITFKGYDKLNYNLHLNGFPVARKLSLKQLINELDRLYIYHS